MDAAQLRAVQAPLKDRYRAEPTAARVTLRSVAVNRSIEVTGTVRAEGDLDFRGTLGVEREAPVGFLAIRLFFELSSTATDEELAALVETTHRYCVVLQTLITPPVIDVVRC